MLSCRDDVLHLSYAPMTRLRKAASAGTLLAWYDRHRRLLPWRAAPGTRPDPYHVWLSEIMLQQTTVAAVVPYFESFLRRWPTVTDLAAADLDEVLHAWQGLGYYARARNLHRCARQLAAAGGRYPDSEAELLKRPGIGPYAAAAIAAIAFGRRAVVVDGNVERVMARMFAVHDSLPGRSARRAIQAAHCARGARPAGDGRSRIRCRAARRNPTGHCAEASPSGSPARTAACCCAAAPSPASSAA
jgi:A/G-specific adenine glycosylase